MKTIRPYLVCVAVVATVGGFLMLVPVILLGPVHDFVGLRNTVYSARFTGTRYDQIRVGIPRARVIDLLGAPLRTSALTNYPVWALRDESVRKHYGTNAYLQIETLEFSRCKNGGDYDMVSVWIGPDNNVIEHYRWVTD